MDTKKCTSCCLEKPINEFYIRRDRNSHVAQCKRCTVKHNSKYRDKEHTKAYKADYYQRNKTGKELTTVLKKYGLTLEGYNEILETQDGVCAICEQPETVVDKRNGHTKRLSIDHSHVTNKVRGLLCSNCNFVLGLAKDSINVLKKAASYLEKYEEKT